MDSIIREAHVSAEKAKAILTSLGRGDEWIEGQDYYLVETKFGNELLWGYGEESAIAANHSSTSWSSPGCPHE